MRHYGDQVIMRERQIASVSIKEIIWEKYWEKEEDKHIKQKFNERAELVNEHARLNIRKIQMTALTMKCYCEHNRYRERIEKLNNGTSSDECPQCSEK